MLASGSCSTGSPSRPHDLPASFCLLLPFSALGFGFLSFELLLRPAALATWKGCGGLAVPCRNRRSCGWRCHSDCCLPCFQCGYVDRLWFGKASMENADLQTLTVMVCIVSTQTL